MLFKNLNLIEPILKALSDQGYLTPTPIQTQAIPSILEGNDLLGCAQTGTGKTAAFSIPILQKLSTKREQIPGIKALILTPTRELAVQIDESLSAYGKYLRLRHAVIFGGVSQMNQVSALKRGVDIVVATPGRLLDLINQRHVDLGKVEMLVLDEADRMLDMGFITGIKKIISKIPEKRQTIFFSATMPDEIQSLVSNILSNPVKIQVAPVSSAAETIKQSVYYVEKNDKKALLQHLLVEESIENVLVFTKTKHNADRVVKELTRSGILAEAIHGNKSQVARQKALNNFKRKKTRVLVATDIAARGIDVSDLSFVINYEIPNCAETYIHRIGRTGRAGAKGTAFSFCDSEERSFLKDINKLIKKNIEVVANHPYESTVPLLVTSKERPNSFSRPKTGSTKPGNKEWGNRSRFKRTFSSNKNY